MIDIYNNPKFGSDDNRTVLLDVTIDVSEKNAPEIYHVKVATIPLTHRGYGFDPRRELEVEFGASGEQALIAAYELSPPGRYAFNIGRTNQDQKVPNLMRLVRILSDEAVQQDLFELSGQNTRAVAVVLAEIEHRADRAVPLAISHAMAHRDAHEDYLHDQWTAVMEAYKRPANWAAEQVKQAYTAIPGRAETRFTRDPAIPASRLSPVGSINYEQMARDVKDRVESGEWMWVPTPSGCGLSSRSARYPSPSPAALEAWTAALADLAEKRNVRREKYGTANPVVANPAVKAVEPSAASGHSVIPNPRDRKEGAQSVRTPAPGAGLSVAAKG